MAFQWLPWQSPLPLDEKRYEIEVEKLRQTNPIPCIWLFGKTGSGKSSVVRYLTGAEDAVIGEGFRPETKTSRRFDFPDSADPLLRFLDTRGLSEASYNPTDDIKHFADTTQLMIVTVRVTDHALSNVLPPLREIRKASPETPVLLVLTCLHEATGQLDITEGEDPFDSAGEDNGNTKTLESIPESLRILITEKESQFEGLYDLVVPIDLTPVEDGCANNEFGGNRLKKAILDKLPHAYRQALLALNGADGRQLSKRQRRSHWQVLTSSALAGSAGAIPVPWVDIPAVLAIQAHMATRIAAIYGQDLTPARWALLSSAVGTRIAIRLAVRELLKLIPIVGMAVGAAGSFAFTYALGMSWDWYFADLQKGHVPSASELKEVFANQLKRGHALWRAE